MRIRDWSSDVCSSDLCSIRQPRPRSSRKRANPRLEIDGFNPSAAQNVPIRRAEHQGRRQAPLCDGAGEALSKKGAKHLGSLPFLNFVRLKSVSAQKRPVYPTAELAPDILFAVRELEDGRSPPSSHPGQERRLPAPPRRPVQQPAFQTDPSTIREWNNSERHGRAHKRHRQEIGRASCRERVCQYV